MCYQKFATSKIIWKSPLKYTYKIKDNDAGGSYGGVEIKSLKPLRIKNNLVKFICAFDGEKISC